MKDFSTGNDPVAAVRPGMVSASTTMENRRTCPDLLAAVYGRIVACCFLALAIAGPATVVGQAQVSAWGNIEGIRIEGELMEFETSIGVAGENWRYLRQTGKERQRSRYGRDSLSRPVTEVQLDSLFFQQAVTDIAPGEARVEVRFASRSDSLLAGTFYCFDLPAARYLGGRIELIDPQTPPLRPGTSTSGANEILRLQARGVRLVSADRQLEIRMSEPGDLIVRADSNARGHKLQVLLPLTLGQTRKGQVVERTFTVKASGTIDREPVMLQLDTTQSDRQFAGLGGNFRIQNPRVDPAVIDYSLENLRVAWGRVEMPWRDWHPVDSLSPIAMARTQGLHPRVAAAMEMAGRLHRLGMPVILSCWWGPDWAIVGPPARGRHPDGTYGNPLDQSRSRDIYRSIADYIEYLRDEYGVEVAMFSFNESDLGIDIRQTAQEHADFIKGFGAYLAERGLKTKLLLGDTADANGYDFLNPAMDDPATHPYIAAVSFHSWRGCTDTTLAKWAAAAERMQVPLIVGEGSIDAGAWRYPNIFLEPAYALEEINLYTRMLAICRPLSILQWQLTADYSPLVGGGVFGNHDEPLRPTQRFWNLKQLANTPPNAFFMSIQASKENISCAALGNNTEKTYAIHLVNNGTTRELILTGLPRGVRSLDIYMTDAQRQMEKGKRIRVDKEGTARFTLGANCYATLISG